MARASPESPSAWAPQTAAQRAAGQQALAALTHAQSAGAAPAMLAASLANAGGAWNAEALLPLLGTGLLASPALHPRELGAQALTALVVSVATGKAGWGSAALPLEDCVVRACGSPGR